ncbi:MAG: hypothetical protein ACJAWV_002519 [Flammeovirgaceae bacterium]|jgi:hypothetical protein
MKKVSINKLAILKAGGCGKYNRRANRLAKLGELSGSIEYALMYDICKNGY